MSELPKFHGVLEAIGGTGHHHGGPGTVFIESEIGDDIYKYLYVDNQDRGSINVCNYPTYINSTILYHLYLHNRSCVRLDQVIYIYFKILCKTNLQIIMIKTSFMVMSTIRHTLTPSFC